MMYTIRRIEPVDAAALIGFYARLSREARQSRFLGGCRGINEAQARVFAGQDGFVAVLREAARTTGC